MLGVPISAVNRTLAVERIARWISDGSQEFVCVRDAHGVIRALDDPVLMQIHHDAGMVTPDGMPLVWSARRAGFADVARVYGPDLVLDIASRGAAEGWSIYYYGGNEGVAEQLASILEKQFPGLVTAGVHCPPFRDLSDDEQQRVADEINASAADIVLVGLSTPKQEHWMSSMRPRLAPAALIGVGAAFDFHTDNVRQAPRWIQRSGFEWLFRVAVEPRRLARRYLRVVPRFALGVLRSPPRRMKPSTLDAHQIEKELT